MNFFLPTTLLAALFSLTGCGQDYSLAPPADSDLVTVTIKVPKELEAEVMNVMYRSPICKRITHGASGQRIELEGYHGIDVQPRRREQSDLYDAQLPVDGGGACHWRLSNVTFGVVYADPTRFGESVTYGAGGGVVVIFDHNNSPRGGADIKVDGNLAIRQDYYPWLSEAFIGGYRKRINLVSGGYIYLMYEALKARQVYFEPVLQSDYFVYSVGPKVKEKGNHATFIYPDGSVEVVARATPDFRRLQTIRLNAEAKQ